MQIHDFLTRLAEASSTESLSSLIEEMEGKKNSLPGHHPDRYQLTNILTRARSKLRQITESQKAIQEAMR